jgi:uncharacterized OsmC-like protein
MTETIVRRASTLRERQAPLKARYEAEPDAAKLTIVVRSVTEGDDPLRARISPDAVAGVVWDAAAHPYAGGDGDLACSGDLLIGSLAACQEITLRMVAAAMGIALREVEVVVEGDMDFRGTMGVDRETPVGFQAIRTKVRVVPAGDVPVDRLERLAQRAERYCVVASTLRQSPTMEFSFSVGQAQAGERDG